MSVFEKLGITPESVFDRLTTDAKDVVCFISKWVEEY